MIVSFAGASWGTTDEQDAVIEFCIQEMEPSLLIHGGRPGADQVSRCIALSFGVPSYAYPSDLISQRAYSDSDFSYVPISEHEKNDTIAEMGDVLIACPDEYMETRHCASWDVVRHARRLGRKLVIIWPDGKICTENMPVVSASYPQGIR